MGKLLAEWFWTDRWMGSSGFLLPMEARGVYREMLTQAWRRGGRLPNDPDQIQRAIGASAKEWARAWPKVERFWRVDGDALVNDTQLEVYAEATAAHERASERGRKAAYAKHKHGSSAAQAQLKAVPEVKSPSPSPSPIVCSYEHTKSPGADAPDWFLECKTLHGGACNGRYAHHVQRQLDEAKAEKVSR